MSACPVLCHTRPGRGNEVGSRSRETWAATFQRRPACAKSRRQRGETGMGTTAELSPPSAATIALARLPPEVSSARVSWCSTWSATSCARGTTRKARHALLAAVRALGLAAGNSGVFGDAARYAPGGRRVPERRAGALARFRRHPRRRLAASRGAGHPGSARRGRDGGGVRRGLLAAIVAGYEVTCRVALALPAGEHYERGFHPTATCGAFGAAAAAARVFGLDAEASPRRSASR